ncbi:MAG: hypothetical protein AAF327_15905 [Cyanobacteria bacterium P01_A01_bin.37]
MDTVPILLKSATKSYQATKPTLTYFAYFGGCPRLTVGDNQTI